VKKRPIDYRDARLVVALVDALTDQDAPVPEAEIVAFFSGDRWTADTVKRTLRELADFGAARRLTPLRQPVAYRLTLLGRAWADRRVEPFVGPDEEDARPE
jgi:hypothetical protein